jgi:lipopolysaccharide export system protein LptA
MKHTGTMLALLAVIGLGFAADLPQVPAPLEQPPPQPGLQIFSKGQAVLSLTDNTIYWTNDVVVVYPAAKTNEPPAVLHCRELTGKRLPSGQVDDIVAQGEVALDRGEDKARGQKAVYTGATQRVVLTGGYGDGLQPMLVLSNGITNHGDMIIYDRAQNKLFLASNTSITVPREALQKGSQNMTNSSGTNKSPILPGL